MLTNNHDQGEINQANGQTSRNGHYEDDADNDDDDVMVAGRMCMLKTPGKTRKAMVEQQQWDVEPLKVERSWQNILWRIAWCDITLW